MILGAIGAFLLIRHYGIALVAPPASAPQAIAKATAPGANVFVHVLIALTAVILTGLLLAKCFAYLGQPPVIGEVLAGIVLGPSFLGSDASAILLPRTVAPILGVIAQLGVLLYMFTVGLELPTTLMRQRPHATVAVSHTSILVPFVLGGAARAASVSTAIEQ
jgi:Kef-type K+ transport system membrane component KefB